MWFWLVARARETASHEEVAEKRRQWMSEGKEKQLQRLCRSAQRYVVVDPAIGPPQLRFDRNPTGSGTSLGPDGLRFAKLTAGVPLVSRRRTGGRDVAPRGAQSRMPGALPWGSTLGD